MLDEWLPDATVITRHRRAADASPVRCGARRRASGSTTRAGSGGSSAGASPARRCTYHELFRTYPFTVLDEGEHHLVSGLCGRIWTLARDYPAIDGRTRSRPGTSRARCASRSRTGCEPDGGGAELYSEARVEPVDAHARLRLKAVWAVVGPFERLVGAEPLALAARRAEARWPANGAGRGARGHG